MKTAADDRRPATLDHAGIAARIPHAGCMCLLDKLLGWSTTAIRCSATSHRDTDNPLRVPPGSGGVLHAAAAIEYAAQAMALHGALSAPANAPPQAGFLAAVRQVRCLVERLDDITGDLLVGAEMRAGDATQASYDFTLHDDQGRLLVGGRATVILDATT